MRAQEGNGITRSHVWNNDHFKQGRMRNGKEGTEALDTSHSEYAQETVGSQLAWRVSIQPEFMTLGEM